MPVIGVAKQGWTSTSSARARATASRSTAASTRRRSRSSWRCCATSTATTPTPRPSPRCASELGDAQHPAHYLAIPPGCSARWSSSSRRPAARRARASSSRSRSAATSRRRAELNAILLQRVRRGAHLPHRPLPRQAAGAQHAVLPLRQRVPRADLEPQPRRERADHDGRGLRRAGPRQVLRRDRHDPRRRAEPPVPGAVQPRDGAAGAHRQRVDARREGEGAEGDRARSSPSDLVRGQFRGYRNEPGVAPDSTTETFAAVQLCARLVALAGRAVLHPRRQVPAGHLHRGDGAPAPPADDVPDVHARRRTTCASASAPRSRSRSARR